MWKSRNVAIVIPCLNEAENIVKTVETVPSFVDEIIVVDDGSTDGTSERVPPNAILLRHEKPRGVGGAIIAGHRRALEEGADMVGVMAGDGQMPPRFLWLLADAVASGADYAKGNRFMRQGDLEGMPLARLIGSGYLSVLTRLVTGLDTFDSQNGYTMISASALKRLDLDSIETGYLFENDMLVHLAKIGAVVRDIPCSISYHAGARSKLKTLRFVWGASIFFVRRAVAR